MNGPEIPFTNVHISSYIKGTAQYSARAHSPVDSPAEQWDQLVE